MRIVEEGQLQGEFTGFEDDKRVFQFFGTMSKWRQRRYYYHYHYAYMPHARVVDRDGGMYLEVDGVGVRVEVERV